MRQKSESSPGGKTQDIDFSRSTGLTVQMIYDAKASFGEFANPDFPERLLHPPMPRRQILAYAANLRAFSRLVDWQNLRRCDARHWLFDSVDQARLLELEYPCGVSPTKLLLTEKYFHQVPIFG